MGNLNELHVPPDADEAADFAARREFGLRYDSYQEATLWGVTDPQRLFACVAPEDAWILDQMREFSTRVDARGF